jgi:WD40 repeat protein
MIDFHPTDTDLRGFVLGDLPDEEWAAIEDHLGACASCVERAAGVQPGDTLVRLLITAGTRMGIERSAATTPLPQDTHSALAGTNAWKEPAAEAAAPEPPPIFAGHPRYKLVRWIGAGGMGSVWEAKHLALDRPVAIKVIRPEFVSRHGAAERFRREARTVARVSHPNIVAAYDAEELGGTHYLVMELVDGENLGERLANGPLPVDEACCAVRDAARGLAHAHAHGLVHRDIKPHNLIRSPDGVVKILDFGLATAETYVDGLTSADMMLGTPDYIAPEQAQDARAADSASDIYSLGCTLFALLSGSAPYSGGTVLDKLDSHRHGSVPPLKNVPRELVTLVERMMAKQPNQRPSANEVAELLTSHLQQSVHGIRLAAAPNQRRDGVRWHLLIGAGFLGLSLLAGVVFKINRDREEITVETDDPHIKVVLRRNGELVRIVDTKTDIAWELDTKKMRLKPDGSDLEIDLDANNPLVLRRQGNKAVTIRHRPVGPPIVENPPHQIRRFAGHRGSVRSVSISSDSKFVVSSSGWPASDQTVRLWDAATGKEVWTYNAPTTVNSVVFRGTDEILVGGFGGLVQLLDRKSGKPTSTYTMPSRATIFSVAVSANGELAAAGSESKFVRIWELATGKERHLFEGHTGWVLAVAFSRDGRQAASASSDGTVRVWDLGTEKELSVYKGTREKIGNSVGFTPDGIHVLFAEEMNVVLWDWKANEVVHRFECDSTPTGFLNHALSKDGKKLLSGGSDNVVRLWDLENKSLLQSLPGHADMIWSLDFAPTGDWAISASGGRIVDEQVTAGGDYSLRSWKLSPTAPGQLEKAAVPTIKPERTLRGHTAEVRDAVFSADGRVVYSGGVDGFVRVHNAETGKETANFEHGDSVMSVGLTEDEKYLLSVTHPPVTGSKNAPKLWIWDLATGKEAAPFPAHEEVGLVSVAVSPNGKRAAVVAPHGNIRIWNIADRKLERTIKMIPAFPLSNHATWSADGKRLAIAGDTCLSVWNPDTGDQLYRSPTYGLGVLSSQFTSDGKRVVGCCRDGQYRVIGCEHWNLVKQFPVNDKVGQGWDPARFAITPDDKYLIGGCANQGDMVELATGKPVAHFIGHDHPVICWRLSQDGQRVVSTSIDSSTRIWKFPTPEAPEPPAVATKDLPTIKPYRTLEGHAQRTRMAIFSRDGKTVYSGGDDNVVRVWDVESGRETAKLPANNWVIALGLADEGRLLVGSTLERIDAWDLNTMKPATPFPALENGDKVQGIAVSPDGRKVAAGSVSGKVRIWDVAERKLEKDFPTPGTRESYRVAWSPDGSQLVAGMDEYLMVYDYPSGTPVHRIWKLRGITNVGVTGDGATIVTHTWDAAVEVYDLKTGRMRHEFNAGIVGNLKGVSGVLIDKDHVVTSGRGHFMDLWNLSGEKQATFSGHAGQVITVNVSLDRRWLASASEDSTVRIWAIPEGLK